LLHLGPGLGNGLANLHNAYRARTPIVSLIGEHATFHRANNPPLASDIAALARPVSSWLKTAATPRELLTLDARGDRRCARQRPGDAHAASGCRLERRRACPAPNTTKARRRPETAPIDDAATALGPAPVLLLGGRFLSAQALRRRSASPKKLARWH
jgi:acetolactate synthase-1/2/3 large subunit